MSTTSTTTTRPEQLETYEDFEPYLAPVDLLASMGPEAEAAISPNLPLYEDYAATIRTLGARLALFAALGACQSVSFTARMWQHFMGDFMGQVMVGPLYEAAMAKAYALAFVATEAAREAYTLGAPATTTVPTPAQVPPGVVGAIEVEDIWEGAVFFQDPDAPEGDGGFDGHPLVGMYKQATGLIADFKITGDDLQAFKWGAGLVGQETSEAIIELLMANFNQTREQVERDLADSPAKSSPQELVSSTAYLPIYAADHVEAGTVRQIATGDWAARQAELEARRDALGDDSDEAFYEALKAMMAGAGPDQDPQ